MKYDGKFETIFEETIMRFQQGGLLEGDYVRFIKNYQRNPKMKDKARTYMERLDFMDKSDLHVKVSAIKAERTESTNGVVGAADAPTGHWADIVVEYAPGLWRDVITVPIEILERIDTGINWSPGTPESLMRKDNTNIKPIEVKQADPNRNLPSKNKRI